MLIRPPSISTIPANWPPNTGTNLIGSWKTTEYYRNQGLNIHFSSINTHQTTVGKIQSHQKPFNGSNIRIFSGSAHPTLAEKISKYLEVPLSERRITTFANGEIYLQLKDSVRGKDTFIVQPTVKTNGGKSVNDHLMEVALMADALKRASAKTVTAILPHYGYARGDKKAAKREPIAAAVTANILQATGVDRTISMDLHAKQIEGMFSAKSPLENISAIPLTAGYIANKNFETDNLVIVSPDAGGLKNAQQFQETLETLLKDQKKKISVDLAIVNKKRVAINQVKTMDLIGDVQGKTAVIVDDLIDTAGTTIGAAQELKKQGAKQVILLATHGIFSGKAIVSLKNADFIDEVVVTDTIPLSQETQKLKKLSVIPTAPLFGEAIKSLKSNNGLPNINDF
ncbi:MAG: ribose-phosphate diphosphokinase [Vampirovibrio sp.]|nr:ribose-phosphate diphosphokinase [Vampirovibrio sp.]